jgi:hypothetical protein
LSLWGDVLAVEDFDDRGTDVPGGVAGTVERVLVVGAGIAGLTVANALTHAPPGKMHRNLRRISALPIR